MKRMNFNKTNLNKEFVKIQIQMFRKSFQRFSSKIHYAILSSIWLMLMFSGCGKEVSVLKNETMEDFSENETTSDSDTENSDTTGERKEEGANLSEDSIENLIYVDVGGAVNCPGVYALPEGSRVFEAIALAGGFAEDAYKKILNQAEILEDGKQIYVYTLQEMETYLEQGNVSEWNDSQMEDFAGKNVASSGKVNLNLADKAKLMTLNGIGETRADAILQYRTEHGKFRSIEELMQVEGIKGKTYEKIKDCITVQ